VEPYFAYWGKARPEKGLGAPCHRLPFHALDVAACAQVLAEQSRFDVQELAGAMGWPEDAVRQLFVFFVALHDVGKFASAFQNLVPELAPRIPGEALSKLAERLRHDTLGWLLWQDAGRHEWFGRELDEDAADFADTWMRVVAGHHGKPPIENFGARLRPKAERYFLPANRTAAAAFARDAAEFLLPDGLPEADDNVSSALKRGTWQLAGLEVLADWLGSNAQFFPYQIEPLELRAYWETTALPRARQAVRAAGLETHAARRWSGAQELLEFARLTPLQQYAATVELGPGPQIFLLEDVTGAGKTEAAFLLAHRMMAAGLAHGLYFALPTMATANQIYERTAGIYQRLYADPASCSLVLAHAARRLVKGFRASVVAAGESPAERTAPGEPSAACAQLNAWLADSGKKALLADVGVGTIDQALLGVLPVRHQSLRLLGLAGKVLIVDEVHAYDEYMTKLLDKLVEVQAMQGGCVVLLSATVPAQLRSRLVAAFARGREWRGCSVAIDSRYPLATQLADGVVRSEACETRAELKRSVTIQPLHSEEDVAERMLRAAENGHCACWIRNTVEDARRGFESLRATSAVRVGLFHSRFAMADRLEIETGVLRTFGKASGPNERRGQLLVATQVVEQSLDLDFDELFIDLAPVDLVIQRAGRLRRHVRKADGTQALNGVDGRGEPVLHILCPAWSEEPGADWYGRMFPKAQFVYPNVGTLWLTERALLDAGRILTPGAPGQTGSVRMLIEAVYGDEAVDIPEALRRQTLKALGEAMANESIAGFNAISLEQGYQEGLTGKWYDESRLSTRLSEEGRPIYLAREKDGVLRPLYDGEFAWEMSAVRVRTQLIDGLAPEWEQRFGTAIEVLRKCVPLLEGEALVLPLVPEGDGWSGMAKSRGRPIWVRYGSERGLDVQLPG
jgi:CRISPR-associated endonuclease/helicase Cas3